MKLQSLTINNYKSFQYPTKISFPSKGVDGKSIFLIGGMNGAGKTSLMEAVRICLFGTSAENIYRNINRKRKALGENDVSFEIVLEMDDLSEIVIQRSWTPVSTKSLKPRDLLEQLKIKKDGEQVPVQRKDVLVEFIESIIPPPITQFFFFDGEKIQDIASDDFSQVGLKSSLEAALGLEYINHLCKDVSSIKQESRNEFVEITDEDLDYKQSELIREQGIYDRKLEDRRVIKEDLQDFETQLLEMKKRFEATFNSKPETREMIRAQEKNKIQISTRLTQIESEMRKSCEKILPYGLLSRIYPEIKRQLELEHESTETEAIRENASELAKRIVRVVEEPEPIWEEKLSAEKLAELERRIYMLLNEDAENTPGKILNLSDRDAARVLNRIEDIEKFDIYSIERLIEEKKTLDRQLDDLERGNQVDFLNEREKDFFFKAQEEIEGCSNQIGRKNEQLRVLEENLIDLEKNINNLQIEIEQLNEKNSITKERNQFIRECEGIIRVLNQYIILLRKKKVLTLQEKTFEMYRRLSSRSDLIQGITIDSESYEIRITDRNGQNIRKAALSAGEKEVFAISLLWGLAQASQLKLPIIIDTPLSRLDSKHRDNIVSSYFPNAGDQVVILSTDTEIDSDYYIKLKPYLSGAGRLVFDQNQESTLFQEGFFWED